MKNTVWWSQLFLRTMFSRSENIPFTNVFLESRIGEMQVKLFLTNRHHSMRLSEIWHLTFPGREPRNFLSHRKVKSAFSVSLEAYSSAIAILL